MSQEGIPVALTIDIHFQIDDSGQLVHPATEQQPFAFSEEAVFKAATDDWVREPGRDDHLDWHGHLVVTEATATLRDIIAGHSVDNLIQYPDEDPSHRLDRLTRDGSLRPSSPRKRIQEELEAALRNAAKAHGAKLLDVALRDIRLDQSISDQWTEAWKAQWDKRRHIELARGRASGLRSVDLVKANAKKEMITAIVESFQDLEHERSLDADIVLLRFIETIRRHAADPQLHLLSPQPGAAVNCLKTLREILDPS
jgi:regulator of protease activity HflC (stomatin/prohibitin superfamily)